jgi:arginyl-tRNA synthetase
MDILTLKRNLQNLVRKNIEKEKALKILEKLNVFLIEDENLGDYSTNLIFLLKQFAPEKEKFFIELIKRKFSRDFAGIEIVNNYLNFYLSDYLLLKFFRQAFKKIEKIFDKNLTRKRKVNIDYVSANPTGPLTLGNARGAVLGDALTNILKLVGFRVTKEYYVNDRGNQIEILGKTILAHLGYLNWEENFYQGEYLRELALNFKGKINLQEKPEKIGKRMADYILKNFIKKSLKKFGTFHDWYFYETELYKQNLDKKVLSVLKKKNLIEEREGALFLLLTKLGENKDEVLIKKTGEPTYFFSDILHYYYKFFIRKNKIDILIVASDHLDHVRRLKKALTIFGIKESALQPIVYQFVHLKKGEEYLKMSKRKGTFITLDDLMSEIDPGIIRFFFLQKSIDSIIEFDLDLAKKESEENPYWYVQYAHARLNSILARAKKENIKNYQNIDPQRIFSEIKDINSAKILLRKIYQSRDLIHLIAYDKKVHLLIEYLINLAKKIHSFYEREKILPSQRKLAFVYFLKNYLAFLLRLINIKPLEKI